MPTVLIKPVPPEGTKTYTGHRADRVEKSADTGAFDTLKVFDRAFVRSVTTARQAYKHSQSDMAKHLNMLVNDLKTLEKHCMMDTPERRDLLTAYILGAPQNS